MYISREKWCQSHTQLIGETGSGKGVAAMLLLSQSIKDGDGVFVFDPKNDEWAPHVMREAATEHGKPFYTLNLNPDQPPQFNLLAGILPHELEELFDAGFSLGETGEKSDFYRLNDRRMARKAAALITPGMSLPELYVRLVNQVPDLHKEAASFAYSLQEISELPVLHTKDGLSLADIISEGGVVYIIGSMRNSRVMKLQKMLLLRVIQLIERRDRTRKLNQVAIFLDELKYLLSKPALQALGTIRDKGGHLILAHQALGDLHDVSHDLKPKAVEDAVKINTAIKIIYRVRDPLTAKWASDLTGKIVIDHEHRLIERNHSLAEIVSSRHYIDKKERPLIDINMINTLPKQCAVFIGSGSQAQLIFTSSFQVNKEPIQIFRAEGLEQQFDNKESLIG